MNTKVKNVIINTKKIVENTDKFFRKKADFFIHWINDVKQKRIVKKELKQQKKDAKKIILFNNSPITNSKYDAFDFKTKACAIKKAIDEKANIIALIGDYGAGKSSLTKLLYQKYRLIFRKPIFINLWDCITEKENTNPEQRKVVSEEENRESITKYFTKSFLYQMASKNKKKTSFSRYINQRLSKNYGKISFAVSTRWSVFLILLGLFFLILFFSFKRENFSRDLISIFSLYRKPIIWNKILTFCDKTPYIFLIPAFLLCFWGLRNNNVLFSLWDSQGKINPSDTDCFEIYKEITNHLRPRFPLLKRKRLIIIEDLDRSENSEIVGSLLKELYRFVSLMDTKEKKQFIFIVSLKSEASLKNKEEKEGLSLYSKIFDYTVWIRPIHFNNVQEIVKPLLVDKIGKKKALKLIDDLDWIMKGSKLTVREIKDRLNEVFLLHQSLVNRDDTTSLVSYKKCSAVVYLQRQYPKMYQILIDNEEGFQKIVTKAYYLEEPITKESLKSLIVTKDSEKQKLDDDFFIVLLELLEKKVIENDYLMYFYNYPRNSYIMNFAEKTVFDYLIHDNYEFDDDNTIRSLLEKIIIDNKGYVIGKAIKELKENNKTMGKILFHFEKLFIFAYENDKKFLISSYKKLFLSELNINDSFGLFYKFLELNIMEEIKKEIIDISIPIMISKNIESHYGIQNVRKTIFENNPEKIPLFYKFCISEDYDLPVIIPEVVETISNEDDLFNCLDFKKITKETIGGYLKVLNNFNFSTKENSLLFISKIKEIPQLKNMTDNYDVLLSLLKKNKIFDSDLFELIYNKYGLNNIRYLIEYIQTINYAILSNRDLQKIDNLVTPLITDTELIQLLEKNNLYKSAIYSRLKLNDFETFDFDNEWLSENLSELATVINQNEPELFFKLRMILIGSCKLFKLYNLFKEPFDFVTEAELNNLKPEDLCYAIDFTRIDDDKIKIIANYCNNKNFTSENLYKFFKAVLFNDDKGNRITEQNYIYQLFSLINYNICNFDSLNDNQKQEILDNISSILELDNIENAIDFIKTVKCHISSLTSIIHEGLGKDNSLFDEYIETCNEISKSSEEVITFISEHEIKCALSKEITDKLLKKKNYENYIIGKSLNDNKYFIDNSIPLNCYYNVYCKNDLYYELVKDSDLINKFYDNNMYEITIFNVANEEHEIDKKRILPFMKFSQTIKLFELILSKLDTNEERKSFIRNIPEFHSYKESELAIELVLKEPYIQMFVNDEGFTNVFKEKLWENDDKGQPKKRVLKSKFTREYNKIVK